jgi:hypothetical protein
MQVEVAAEKSNDIQGMIEMLFSSQRGGLDRRVAQGTSNIRAVGFIAKPEKVNDLTTSMKGPLMALLGQIPGFTGAMILHSHKEWRSVTMLTFWETELQAIRIHWENFPSVRKLISPLVDAYTRVQTFQGTFPEANTKLVNRPLTEADKNSF